MHLTRGVLHKDLKPIQFFGEVIKGFGRGSKDLGCPTANISIEPYRKILDEIPLGVYWGVASVNGGPVFGMALNVGWSPFYGNKEKTIEIHVLNKFKDDFYGEQIRAVALGYIRPEANFDGVESLKKAIAEDLEYAKKMLDSAAAKEWSVSEFMLWKKK